MVRLPKFKIDDEESRERFAHSKLMTYIPWRKEMLTDLMVGFESYQSRFRFYQDKIENLMETYEKSSDDINRAFEDIDSFDPDLHAEKEDLKETVESDEVQD